MVGEDALQAGAFGAAVGGGVVVASGEVGVEQGATVGPEHSFGVEPADRVEQRLFVGVDGFGVAGEEVGAAAIVAAGPAQIPGQAASLIAVHASSAVAEQQPAEQVGASDVGADVVGTVGAGILPGAAVGLDGVIHRLRDQRRVSRLGGPHPLHRVVDRPGPGAARAAVEHHVSGVFGVSEDLIDGGLAPRAAGAGLPAGRLRGRVAGQVGVETFGDGGVADALVVAPLGDLGDGLGAGTVGFEAGFGVPRVALVGFGWRRYFAVYPQGGFPMLNPSRVWVHNPPQDCSRVLSVSYSAMDWLIRRCKIRCARLPETVIGSLEANRTTSHRSNARSTVSPS